MAGQITPDPPEALAIGAVEMLMKLRFPLAVCALLGSGTAVDAIQVPVFFDDFEAGDVCAWSSVVPAIAPISELEAPDRSSNENDLAANAQAISRCAIVDGVSGPLVEEKSEEFEDVDLYKFVATGPMLLHVTLARGTGGTSDFEPAGALDDDGNPETLELGLLPLAADGMTSTREIWIPESGVWYLQILDARNLELPTAGAIDSTYRVTLDIVPVTGIPVFFPSNGEPGTIPADGSVAIYELDGDATETLDFVETYAERLLSPVLPIPDTKLFVVQPVAGGWLTLAANDDWDPFFDSRIEAVPLDSGPYFLIVDFWDIYDEVSLDSTSPPAAFEIDISYLQFGR